MEKEKEKKENKLPVFYDPSRMRWKLFLVFAAVLSVCVFFVYVNMFKNILGDKMLPDVFPIKDYEVYKYIQDSDNYENENIKELERYKNDLKAFYEINTAAVEEQNSSQTQEKNKIIGFMVNWDPKSFDSLKENIDKIDVLIPEWIHLSDSEGNIYLNNRSRQVEIQEYISLNRRDLEITPLINNYDYEKKIWDTETLVTLLRNQNSRATLIDKLFEYITVNRFSGINIDFEEIDLENQKYLVLFMSELSQKFKENGLTVSQSLPLDNDSVDYYNLQPYSDHLILMAYDQHWSTGVPGTPASQTWVSQGLLKRFQQLPSDKIIVALGNYGYDWKQGDQAARAVSYQEIINILKKSEGNVSFSSYTLSPYFSYLGSDEVEHSVWFLDGISFFNQVVFASELKPAGYGLWRLGSEDPSVWEILKNIDNIGKETAEKLTSIPSGYGINYQGYGEILKVTETPKTGKREINYSESLGIILDEKIVEFNSPYVIERFGRSESKKIALTFDDGPDEVFTPQILNELKKYDVKATFFVIGANIERNKDLINRIYNEGHEIGNHTFSHPDISKISPNQIVLEVNALQKQLEILLGKRSILFRAPYSIDMEPKTVNEISALEQVGEYGYYDVSMNIDPKDWTGNSSQKIKENTLDQIDQGLGNIVLLHDGGGDRNQTVGSLSLLIPELKDQGYEFVTVSNLLGLSRDDVMPPVDKNMASVFNFTKIGFTLLGYLTEFIKWLFVFGISVGVVRLLSNLVLIVYQKYRQSVLIKNREKTYYNPKVSVLIPAYNEEKVIIKSIFTALKSDYPNFEVIVIDDGSKDNTYQIAKSTFVNEKRVKVFKTSKNVGKSSALNLGLKKSKSNYVVVLDADTLLKKDALTNLVWRIKGKKVGAVAGNVKVGNRHSLLAKFQALEYITSQNVERRAHDVLNCITIVPGAIGMWRRSLVLKAGGFNSQTLAEDAELTLRIFKMGYKVVYEESTIGYTEAPESMESFYKQRFRWMFGRLQIMRKHIDMMLNYKYKFLGLYALPMVFLLQIVFTLLAPLLDIYWLFILGVSIVQKLHHPELSPIYFTKLFYAYALFLGIDILSAAIAIMLEHKEDYKLIIWVPFQRLFYRWIYYFVAYKVFVTAIKGPHVDWGKFERTATVKLLTN